MRRDAASAGRRFSTVVRSPEAARWRSGVWVERRWLLGRSMRRSAETPLHSVSKSACSPALLNVAVPLVNQFEHDAGLFSAGFARNLDPDAFVIRSRFVEFRRVAVSGRSRTQAQHHGMFGGGAFAAGFGHGLEGCDAVRFGVI